MIAEDQSKTFDAELDGQRRPAIGVPQIHNPIRGTPLPAGPLNRDEYTEEVHCKLLWAGLVLFFSVPGMAQQEPNVSPSAHHDVSPPLKDLRPPAGLPPGSLEKTSAPELRYRLLQRFGGPWFCDHDFFPQARDEGSEAARTFPRLQQDEETFRAIAGHLGMAKAREFSGVQKLLIYREYKKLSAIHLEPYPENAPYAGQYRFSLSVPEQPGKLSRVNGFVIEGLIGRRARIEVLKKEPAVLGCPICLAAHTTIDTPDGPVAVEDLKKGMMVWTLDAENRRVAAPILKTAVVSVVEKHWMTHLALQDGREVWASPGHPTADGRGVAQLAPHAFYDKALVVRAELVSWEGAKTYDLLPAGDTGFYWAQGILLASTLR